MDLIRTNLDDLDSRISATAGEGSIKGWINFNGLGTISIRDSLNVTSITDNGTGEYTITWDVDFLNTNYAISGAAVSAFVNLSAPFTINVGSVDICVRNGSDNAVEDSEYVSVLAIGDQ